MSVLSTVTERLDQFEATLRRFRDKRETDTALVRRIQATQELRETTRPRLIAAAERIFAWRASHMASKPIARYLSVVGREARIPLFEDWYWDGLPTLPHNPFQARTVVTLKGPKHHFYVETRRKRGSDHVEDVVWNESCQLLSHDDLVDALHPDMLLAFEAHLNEQRVWDTIAKEIEALTARYVHG